MCNCEDEGCKYFGDMLQQNHKIKSLSLCTIFICLNLGVD